MEGSEKNLEEFSVSNTVVFYSSPLSLLRGPVLAGASDDSSIGQYLLAFRDASSWRSAYKATESKIMDQCEVGARVACSIQASKRCRRPWWKALFGISSIDYSERERCEEREMSACLAASRALCLKFAKEKCLSSFRSARVAVDGWRIPPDTDAASKVTNYKGAVLFENCDNDGGVKSS